jgi:hypothetical protein
MDAEAAAIFGLALSAAVFIVVVVYLLETSKNVRPVQACIQSERTIECVVVEVVPPSYMTDAGDDGVLPIYAELNE